MVKVIFEYNDSDLIRKKNTYENHNLRWMGSDRIESNAKMSDLINKEKKVMCEWQESNYLPAGLHFAA